MSSQDHQSRKRKLSPHQADIDNSQNHKKKRVKAEPETKTDVPIKKKKRLTDSTNDLYDESFLHSKVKSEQSFGVPSAVKVKKKKKKNVSIANDTSMSNGNVIEPELQSSDSIEIVHGEVSIDDISVTDSSHTEKENNNKYNIIKVKKNKKKHDKKTDNSEEDDVQNGAEESTVTESYTATDVLSENNASTHNHVTHNKTRTNKISNKNNQETILNTNDVQNGTSVRIHSESSFAKRKSRMSERIEFEEDDSDVQIKSNSTDISVKSTDNKKLRSFLESGVTLRPYRPKLPSALVLTDDDDVWLIRCPKDVKLESFQDKKWVLDSRCKIKLDGQTYEGDIGDTTSNITVLSSKKDRAVIKNVTINGCVRLRRRLPKVHIQEDNVMINNQTNFIPLPDTKCRHPLFGLNYKKAMKLPSGVAERLRAARAAAPAAGGKKKKKRDRERPDDDQLKSFKMEHKVNNSHSPEEFTKSMIISKKKKNKRKHSDVMGDESAPRHKKPKRNLESSEVWESEKAIEENLFNF